MTGINLVYDVSVVGFEAIDKALGSVNKSINSAIARAEKAAKRPPLAQAAAEKAAAREKAKLDQNLARAGMSLDKQRGAALFSQFKAQEREQIQSSKRVEAERIRAEKAIAREAKRSAQEQRAFMAKTGMNALGNVGGMARRGLTYAAGAGTALLTAGVVTGVKKALETEEAINHLGRSASLRPEERAAFKAETGQKAAAASRKFNYDQTEILSGAQNFTARTGDAKTAIDNMGTFAEVARATNAEISDISSNAAALSLNFGIKDVGQMKHALAAQTEQGRRGSMEIPDFAAGMMETSASAKAFGLTGVQGAIDTGALLQLAFQGTGSADESKTAVADMFNELKKHADKLGAGKYGKALSIYKDPNDKLKGTKDISDILPKLVTAVGGDPGKLIELLGARAVKAYNPMLGSYSDAYNATKGTKAQKQAAGEAAAKGSLDKFTSVQGDYAKSIGENAQEALTTTSAQLEMAWRDFTTELAERALPMLKELTPKLKDLVPAIGELVDRIIKVAEFFADNPFTGIGLLVAGSITKDLVTAGIGQALKGVLVSDSAAAIGGLTTALGGLSVGLAAAGVALAVWANEDLKKTTGGLGIGDLLGGYAQGVWNGTGSANPLESFKDQMNEQQNKNARGDYLKAHPDMGYGANGYYKKSDYGEGAPAEAPKPDAPAAPTKAIEDNTSTMSTHTKSLNDLKISIDNNTAALKNAPPRTPFQR